MSPQELPVLWHLKVSNYNEKARWALDYKRVAHARRAPVPGRHRGLARRLAGIDTLPVLMLDWQGIGDSTRIIEALERLHPDPPLYPGDPSERQRALMLEDHFDEHLGPSVRLRFLHHALPDPRLMLGAFVPELDGARYALARAMYPAIRRRTRRDFGIDSASVAQAYEQLAAAGEVFRSSLQPSGYLVGDHFTVADLTLAALVAPIVSPPEFPYPQPQRRHRLLAGAREALAREGILYWSRTIYARHRGSSAEVGAANVLAGLGRSRNQTRQARL